MELDPNIVGGTRRESGEPWPPPKRTHGARPEYRRRHPTGIRRALAPSEEDAWSSTRISSAAPDGNPASPGPLRRGRMELDPNIVGGARRESGEPWPPPKRTHGARPEYRRRRPTGIRRALTPSEEDAWSSTRMSSAVPYLSPGSLGPLKRGGARARPVCPYGTRRDTGEPWPPRKRRRASSIRPSGRIHGGATAATRADLFSPNIPFPQIGAPAFAL